VTPPRPDPQPPTDPTSTTPTPDPGTPTNPLPTHQPPPPIDTKDDALTTDEDASATLDVMANDVPPDGQTIAVSTLSKPAHGSVSNGQAGVVYTPDVDFNGTDWFVYTVRDDDGTTATSRVDVTVLPVDDLPTAIDDTATVTEDVANAHVDVLANDTDADGDALTLVATGVPSHGSSHVTPGGKLAYTPAPDFHGQDSVTYTVQDSSGWTATATVTIAVTSENDDPVAVDDSVTVAEDSTATVLDLVGNDSDPDADALTLVSVSGASHGTVRHHTDGSWTYRPDPDFNGAESLVYSVSDGQASASGVVTIVVSPVDDAPVAVDDNASVLEDAINHPIDVLANDSDEDGDVLSVVAVGSPAHGTAAIMSGQVVYTPDADYHGGDTFDYTVQGGTGLTSSGDVTVSVQSVNDAPAAVDDSLTLAEDSSDVPIVMLGNDTDADGDALSVTSVTGAAHGTVTQQPDGSYTYLPEPDYAGSDSLTYTVSDGNGGTATGTVTVTVSPVNDAPATGPDAYDAATTDLIMTVNAANGVLANDVDADGDTLTVVSDDSAAIDINADGSITYVLPLFGVVQTVQYVVTDGTTTATGTAVFTVTLLPTTVTPLFMQPVDTTSIGDLATSPPSGGVTDLDGDGHPGLTIKDSDLHENEPNPSKFQLWEYTVPGGGVTLNGPIKLDLWTQLNHAPPRDLEYAAWVYDCNAGGTCSPITSAVGIRVRPWSTAAGWQERVVTVGTGNGTIAGGHTIRVRLAFHREDVWLALDSAHPSSLRLTF
jgi:VCBS repeat-containing protein